MNPKTTTLEANLDYLKLRHILEHYKTAVLEAARKDLSHIDFLSQLIEQEALSRCERAVERRVEKAHFPTIKTLAQFQWSHPETINRKLVQNLFHLHFIENKHNVVFCGTTGLGKTHLAIALAHTACCQGNNVLFTSAFDMIQSLAAAPAGNSFNQEMKKYTAPALLVIDQIGYTPIDQIGTQLLFQVISYRYERNSIILTTNRSFKEWPVTFNNDSCLTSAILDRLLHHSETILIEGNSYRMKGKPSE